MNAGAHDVKECSMREGCYSEKSKGVVRNRRVERKVS